MKRQRSRLDDQSRRASRRPGIFPGRRFALAVAVVGAILAVSPGVAAADVNSSQPVSVEIYPSSGAMKTESITVGALEANCTLYSGPNVELYRNGSQVPGQQVTKYAWSLADVLGCLPTPVSAKDLTGVTVVQSTGVAESSESSQLVPADLTTPSDFASTSEVPVIFSDGTNLFYDRPWRGAADDNADDQVTESNNSPLSLEVFQGPLLTVTPTASQTSVPAGTTVTFGTKVTGVSGTPSYSWDFDGGATNSTLAAPQVSFATAGTYRVTVQVTDGAGGGGVGEITITVTSAATPTTPSGGHQPSGPQGSNGNNPRGPKGKSGSPQSPTTGKPHGKKGAASGKPTRAKHTTPASTGTTGSPSNPPSNSSATTSHPSTPAQSTHHPAPGTKPSSSLVRGRLIGDVTALPASESPLVHAVPAAVVASAPAVRRVIGASVLPALAAGLAVILIFAIGAGRELRWRREWRLPRLGN